PLAAPRAATTAAAALGLWEQSQRETLCRSSDRVPDFPPRRRLRQLELEVFQGRRQRHLLRRPLACHGFRLAATCCRISLRRRRGRRRSRNIPRRASRPRLPK
ncbi:unnamed protein product, partial [Ectocarpus sp. 8 AP-2014]